MSIFSRFFRLLLLACAAIPVAGRATPPKEPYLDPDLPVEKRLDDLLARMTIEEKAQALDHKGKTLDRFHLPADQWNQCLNGVQWDRPTTLFPSCIAMGATWDPVLVEEIATALSDEARAIHNAWRQDPEFQGQKKGLIYRDPVINISRNPYWGRIHEVFSEDPHLTGRMAVAYVRGLQGTDPRYLKIASTLKHFAVNNVETGRQKLDAKVPERWLREYWLPHFRDAVVEGGAQSLMASYNAINGTPNNRNRWLLTDLLKNEWKHQGFVVSDLGGVKTMVEGHQANRMTYVDAVAQSVTAGCDFSDKEYAACIPEAVAAGKLDPARLDDAVRRVLRVRMRLGEFDPPERLPWHDLKLDVLDNAAHRDLAARAARESIVLLVNKDSFLPLDPAKLRKVAVIGPHADRITINNYNGRFRDGVTALRGLRDRLPASCEVVLAAGCAIGGPPHPWVKDEAPPARMDEAVQLAQAVEAARAADAVVLCLGTNQTIEQEGRDRTTLTLPEAQEKLAEEVLAANPRTAVVLMSAGPLATPRIKEQAPALLQAWWGGEEGGHALADVLVGAASPAGRLPYTMYASDAQVPPVAEYDISKGWTYMFVKGEPLFPFGHGLSYTSFRYGDLRLSVPSGTEADTITATLEVTNTGNRAGDEVVQFYTRALRSEVAQPARQLRAFRRLTLAPGQSTTVSFTLPVTRLAWWDETRHAFRVEAGEYRLEAGASSADIRSTAGFVVK